MLNQKNHTKLLYFSAQIPSQRVPIAGQKVAWNHLNNLAVSNDIILMSFFNEKEKEFFVKNDYDFCEECMFYQTNKFLKFKNGLKYFRFPFKTSGRFEKEILKTLISKIDQYNINKVFFEFTSSLLYARQLKQLRPELTIEFVEHDVTFQSFERLSAGPNIFLNFFYSMESKRMKRFEIESLKLLDKIYTLNQKDERILDKEGIKNIEVLFPKVDDWIAKVKRKTIPYTLLFLGAMHRKENQDAVQWFSKSIFPEVLKQFPNSKLYIVGGGAPDGIRKLHSNNIEVTGFVENLKPYFENAQLAVVPLRFGAGIKIKTLETISAKIPTIATEIGAEGIPGNEFLYLADTKEEFINQISYFFNKES